jgi:hypothetical protein
MTAGAGQTNGLNIRGKKEKGDEKDDMWAPQMAK